NPDSEAYRDSLLSAGNNFGQLNYNNNDYPSGNEVNRNLLVDPCRPTVSFRSLTERLSFLFTSCFILKVFMNSPPDGGSVAGSKKKAKKSWLIKIPMLDL
ncbi:MAG: hypothetical protein PVF73_12675, partial [Bacteroidales bacterium]